MGCSGEASGDISTLYRIILSPGCFAATRIPDQIMVCFGAINDVKIADGKVKLLEHAIELELESGKYEEDSC